jgi:hypothetical protein
VPSVAKEFLLSFLKTEKGDHKDRPYIE